MKRCADSEAGPSNIAGIPVNLRIDQDDVDHSAAICCEWPVGRTRR